MLSRTVPANRNPSCGTTPSWLAQRLLRHVAKVDAVDRDAALDRVVEAGEELRDRRLARARVADEGDRRPGGDVEVDSVQHLGARRRSRSGRPRSGRGPRSGRAPGVRLVADLGLLVHHVHDLVERRDRREERVVELRELLDGVEEVRQVEDEREERADREAAAEDEIAAVAEHDRGRERREEVDEREVEPVQEDRLLVRLAVVRVDLAEVPLVRPLAPERLDDAHATDVLGERRRDEAEPLPNCAVGAGRADAEERRCDQHQRQHGQRREREPPVEEEEDDRRAEQEERALDERRHAVGYELVERLDVVRQPADDHARAVALVEAEREPLQVPEELVSEVGQDPLARPAGEVRLRRARSEVQHSRHNEEHDDDRQDVQVVLLDPWSIAILARYGGASAVAVAARRR